ncbi:hypothetical protein D3C87_143830 [compost metagenome]
MNFFKSQGFSYILVVASLTTFAWWEMDAFHGPRQEGSLDLASKVSFETAASCGPERTYLLPSLAKISPVYRLNRSRVPETHVAKECVSYIMQNFISPRTKSSSFAQCPRGNDGLPGEPTIGEDRSGNYLPCVTQEYVNATYHALVDVSDCLNIEMGELLPKLYNESGLHMNTLGGGFDAGIGQLTVSALREVYMSYNGNNRNPSSLNWYLAEVAKSPKPSCQRIAADKSLGIVPPKGKKLCKLNEAEADSKLPAEEQTCYKPWARDVRCVVMEAPSSPLRNVFYTGVFYRAMLKSVTGLNYAAGEDTIDSRPYTGQQSFNGYLGINKFADRIRKLGATGVTETALKQMIISLGFNAGIGTGNVFLNNYLKQKEAKNVALKDADFDFQNTTTGKWAIVTNLPTFWRGLGSDDTADYEKALMALEVLKEVGLDADKAKAMYKTLREPAFKERKKIEDMKITQEEKDKRILQLKIKYDRYRHPLLAAVFAKSDQLSFPEFMRVAHADKIVNAPGTGGAPGYVSFIANKHKQLDSEMGAGVCTSEKYLQF